MKKNGEWGRRMVEADIPWVLGWKKIIMYKAWDNENEDGRKDEEEGGKRRNGGTRRKESVANLFLIL